MNKRKFGMKTLNISQGRNGGYSHKNLNAYDLTGEDSGIDKFTAYYPFIVIGVHKFNFVNGTGFANTVHFYDDENDVTIAMTHMNDVSKFVVGKRVLKDEIMYLEGTAGKATGNHIHLEIGKGRQPKKYQINGKWQLKDLINIEDYFYLDETHIIKKTQGYNFEIQYSNATKITKEKGGLNGMDNIITKVSLNDKEWEYMFSLDGNKFGTAYDKTTMKYFNDRELETKGWEKYIVVNASIFYSYDGKTYAEGVEKSRGLNNQPLDMNAVTKFNDTMAIAMTYDGKLVFEKQKDIIKNLDNYYGAFTGMFGIMKDGQDCKWGVEIEQHRNNMYSNKSGRTVIGYSSITNEVIILTIKGVTGKTGVRGNELFELCKQADMTNAMCCDGGGSVFLIKDGQAIVSSNRAVKNAFLVYRRKRKQNNTSNENTGNTTDVVKPKEKTTEDVLREENEQLKLKIKEYNDIVYKQNEEIRLLEQSNKTYKDLLKEIKEYILKFLKEI